MAGPLSGLKVIELAGLGPCPLAGQLMGDLGAEVIVIDRKSKGLDKTDINNRSKRSIALDLKSAKGIEIALKLVETGDVLIEGFRPGVMERLGLGPDICKQINPRLVYGRITGWGQDGPLSQTAGHDINYLSITGALGAIGQSSPIPPLNLVADYGGGTMFLVMGVLAALYERETSGLGQVIDAAMNEGVSAQMGLIHSMIAKGEWSNQREGNLLDGGAPFYKCYETLDEKYLSVGPLEPQFFAELIRICGLDEALIERQYDRSAWDEIGNALQASFKSKTRSQWEAAFKGSDGCIAPVLDFDEIEAYEHNRHRNVFKRIDGVLQAAPAPRFDRTPALSIGRPAKRGGDSSDILAELGYDKAMIERLRASKILT